MSSQTICLVGQALVDVTLKRGRGETKMRLGGIAHAARALWALGADYRASFIAPTYLTNDAERFFNAHGAKRTSQIGIVTGAPNVMLIEHAEEAGPQGYELLLRDEHRVTLDMEALREATNAATDVLAFPDSAYLKEISSGFTEGRLYVDADIDFGMLNELGMPPPEVAILSTSSNTFQTTYGGNATALSDAALRAGTKRILLKENRGGSRLFKDGLVIQTPAQVRPIVHSVGVGDCFDAALCVLRQRYDDATAMAYAASVAAEYASTTDPTTFKKAVTTTMAIPPDEIVVLQGVSLPWESRAQTLIYVAAPDFDYVDQQPIDALADALSYHGFSPRLPVRENGQLELGATNAERRRVANADLALLNKCSVLVAVMLYDDPGTLIEVGLALERKLPVIIFDPYRKVRNPMLTELATTVSSTLDGVVAALFEQVGHRT